MRSLRKKTHGGSAVILPRRVPRCVNEDIEAGYTEVPRTNRRKKAAQAWTLKVKLWCDSRPPAQVFRDHEVREACFGHRSPARQSNERPKQFWPRAEQRCFWNRPCSGSHS